MHEPYVETMTPVPSVPSAMLVLWRLPNVDFSSQYLSRSLRSGSTAFLSRFFSLALRAASGHVSSILVVIGKSFDASGLCAKTQREIQRKIRRERAKTCIRQTTILHHFALIGSGSGPG